MNEELVNRLMKEAGGGLKNLAPAYVKAWAEIGAVVKKDANNPHYGNDYASLESVVKLAKPVFAKHDLALLQTPGEIDGNGNLTMMGLLMHSSGESISFKTIVPLGGKLTAQAMGSATAYGRRYQWYAVAGVAQSDDDGEAASRDAAHGAVRAAKSTPPNDVVAAITAFTGTEKELEEKIRPLVEELGDQAVNKLYVAKRRELKGKTAGK